MENRDLNKILEQMQKLLNYVKYEVKNLEDEPVELNIPIYRAKIKGYTNANDFAELFDCKSDISKDGYVIGMPKLNDYGTESFMDYRIYDDNGVCIGVESIEIEPDTRSINLSDMIDSEGTKIFASLSENGKGGDTIESKGYTFKCFINRAFPMIQTENKEVGGYVLDFENLKVTGIQE